MFRQRTVAVGKVSVVGRRALAGVLAVLAIGTLSHRSEAGIVVGAARGSTTISEYNTATQTYSSFNLTAGNVSAGGVAYGPGGDLYVAEQLSGSNTDYFVEKYSVSGTDLGLYTSIASPGLIGIGLVFDSSGNLFASETSAVFEYPALGVPKELTTPNGSFYPGQMAISSTGILYVTDLGSGNVYQYNTSQASPSPTLFANIPGANGLLVTSQGNVLASEAGGIYEYNSAGTLIGTFSSLSNVYGMTYDDGDKSTVYGVRPPGLYAITSTGATDVTDGFGGVTFLTDAPASVPEPSSFVMMAVGAPGLTIVARARRSRR